MVEKLFGKQNVSESLAFLMQKKNSCGMDGFFLHDLPEHLEFNLPSIKAKIEKLEYIPTPVKCYPILEKSGKERILSTFSSLDRFILRCLYQVLDPLFSSEFSVHSHAYQKDKGIQSAVGEMRTHLEQGASTVLSLDLENFFGSIPHDPLMTLVKEKTHDPVIIDLIEKFIKVPVFVEGELLKSDIGLLQGNPLSPLLSNLYLHPLDLFLETNNIPFVRFADDIKVFTWPDEDAKNLYMIIQSYIQTSLKLRISAKKSGIYPSDKQRYLGYHIHRDKHGYQVVKHHRQPTRTHHRWHKSALVTISGEYHILSSGVLTRKDFTILFENDNQKVYLPVNNLHTLHVYSDVVLNGNLLSLLAEKGIRLNIFSDYGEYKGCLMPPTHKKDAHLLLSQAHAYNDPHRRLQIAKTIIMTGLFHMRNNLRYYHRKYPNERISDTINRLSQQMKRMNEATDVPRLMMIEAHSRQLYYSAFNDMIRNTEFRFTTRTKRPPKDPLNALISFTNTLIYQTFSTEIQKTELDIRIAFLHSARKKRINLALDLAELYKPLIGDRIIFTMLNKHMVHPDLHFTPVDSGVHLNRKGKEILIQQYHLKLRQRIQVEGESQTYLSLIRKDIRELIRFLQDDGRLKFYKPTK